MNGVHDMGGMMGFGPVRPEADEPVFHADWEKRVFAMNIALGPWNIDMSRHSIERMDPADYLRKSYYEKWLESIERLLCEHGLVSADEIVAGKAEHPLPEARALRAEQVPAAVAKGKPYQREPHGEPLFAVGQTVCARVMGPRGHTRLPRYAMGRAGTVAAIHGCHVFPDASARGEGEQSQWLYTVRFPGSALWGADADPGLSVSIEAWESYLEPA